MTQKIKPFQAIYYSPKQTKDYSLVTCPPYDVISKQMLQALRKKSAHNFSRIIIADNKQYTKSNRTFQEWLNQEILIKNKKHAFYLYEQNFRIDNTVFKRFGIITLLKMDKRKILPHEYTLKAPKTDRKKMMNAVKGNLSPIFVIASHKLKELENIYKKYSQEKPFLCFKDNGADLNRVWIVEDKHDIQKITKDANSSSLVIADGHHRFETSYDYFLQNKGKFKDLNYLVAYITSPQKGLVILPTHRVVCVKQEGKVLFEKLDKHFTIEETSEKELKKKLESINKICFGIFQKGKFYFLKLKNIRFLSSVAEKEYRSLPTYVLHKTVLPLLDVTGNIEYTHSIKEAQRLAGSSKTAFILKPVSLKSIFRISKLGLRFPQKSTYFYPKLLSGIVVRKFSTK